MVGGVRAERGGRVAGRERVRVREADGRRVESVLCIAEEEGRAAEGERLVVPFTVLRGRWMVLDGTRRACVGAGAAEVMVMELGSVVGSAYLWWGKSLRHREYMRDTCACTRSAAWTM